MKTILYRHYDADGILLYVGITLNFSKRLWQHLNYSDFSDRIAKSTLTRFDTRHDAIKAEIEAIKNEVPFFNKNGNVKARENELRKKFYDDVQWKIGLSEEDKKKIISSMAEMVPPGEGQRGLAKKLGVSESYVSLILSGKRQPGKKILRALGLKRTVIPISATSAK
jgi:predicted GIY-YIG superfamily endonuclease